MRDYKYLQPETFHLAAKKPWKKVLIIIAEALLLGIIISLLIILFAVLTSQAEAAENPNAWSWQDTTLQGIFSVVLAMDYSQTLYGSRHPQEYGEMNSILKDHMEQNVITEYFVAYLIGHAVISYLLPRPWRTAWQGIYIGMEATTVNNNRQYGAGLNFKF